MQKIKIAFDLDGVIVDKPLLMPKKLLEKLFKGSGNNLHYRFPESKLEQTVRKISHYYLLRPPIKENILFIKKLVSEKKYELFIVSGRYSFLEKETDNWLGKRRISHLFKGIYLNFKNEQPHLFKERILKEIKPDIYVDDDGPLADYLLQNNVAKIFCYGKNQQCQYARPIDKIEEILR